MPAHDPLLWLTLGGLVAGGFIATLHEPQEFDPEAAASQTGRNLHFDLTVESVEQRPRVADGWLQHEATGSLVAFLWFEPAPQPLHPGDRLQGVARLEARPGGLTLVLSGTHAAFATADPTPLRAEWQHVMTAPERFDARTLLLPGAIEGAWLVDPEGKGRCLLHGAPAGQNDPRATGRAPTLHALRFERASTFPGWACRPMDLPRT